MDGFTKYHFKDLGEEEKILKVLHRNWFYLLEQYIVILAVAGLFAAALIYAPTFFPDMFSGRYKALTLFVENFFMLAVWIYGFMIWIDYYFDIWIITSERIINIEQKGMFMRRVSEVSYSKIQDITTIVTGFIPTILNFGDLKIQTAGEDEEFVFRTISDPYYVKNIIVAQQKQSQKDSTEELGEMIKEKIQE